MKTNKKMTVFMLKMDNSPKFAFHAADMQDATRKAAGWARYHGWSHEEISTFTLTPAAPFEAKNYLHDEYID